MDVVNEIIEAALASMRPGDASADQVACGALHDRIEREVEEGSVGYGELLDGVALNVAHRFLLGTMEFVDADDIMNCLWGLMCTKAPSSPIPELARSIFEAFDEGEYDHHDGSDPVVAFTIPMLDDIIRRRRGLLSP